MIKSGVFHKCVVMTFAAAGLGAASFAAAQSGIEEVVVTAQKREQSLQETAVAVSALTGANLDSSGIREALDLESSVPNLQVGRSLNNVVVNIRGISSNTFTVASDPSVAFYVDGVYKPRNTSPNALFLDVERLEVLRGPQGTLYGRNATGGAINVISKKASFDGTTFDTDLTFGNYNNARLRAVLNTPLIDNKLAARIAVLHERRDGFQKVIGPPDDNQALDDTALRAQILWQPSDEVALQVIANYFDKSGPDGNHFKPLHPFANPLLYAGATPNNVDDPFSLVQDFENDSDKSDFNLAATLDWAVGNYDLKAIVAWQDHKDKTSIDLDASELDILVFNSDVNSEALSLEAQISSNHDSMFNWIGGIYYIDEEGVNPFITPSGPDFAAFWAAIGLLPPGADAGDLINIHESTNKAWAVFGETYFNLSDTLRLTLGVRYTDDEKIGSANNVETFFFGAEGLLPRSFEDSEVTWKTGLEWQVTDSNFLYGTISTGYKAGGFNMETAPPGFPQSYNSEQLLAYELGSKNLLANDRLRLNLAGFYYDYEDFQEVQVITVGGAVTQSTVNAGSATSYGLEAEFVWLASEALTISGQYSYLKPEFDDFLTADVLNPTAPARNLAGNDFARSPNNTFTLAAEYEWRLPGGATITPRFQYYWQDDMFLRPFNDADPILRQDSFSRSGARLSYRSANGLWELSAFVNNIEDEAAKNFLFIGPEFMGSPRVGYFSPPRTYGITLAYEYN